MKQPKNPEERMLLLRDLQFVNDRLLVLDNEETSEKIDDSIKSWQKVKNRTLKKISAVPAKETEK